MDEGYRASDLIEDQLLVRVREIYTAALRTALKSKKAALKKVSDIQSGKTPAPATYAAQGEEAVKRWRDYYVRKLARGTALVESIAAELDRAGVEASDVIRKGMAEIYAVNLEEAQALLQTGAENAGLQTSFAMPTRAQIDVILQEQESPMSKIAYNHLGDDPAARRRLQTELALATALGEEHEKLIRRIEKVAGMSYGQAKRVAQTERTRVQSQARWQAGEEAKAAGVSVYNTWSTRMVRSRETHISLDGQQRMQGDAFVTSAGNALRYPGDPSAPAREVINCHCVLVPDVLEPGQTLEG